MMLMQKIETLKQADRQGSKPRTFPALCFRSLMVSGTLLVLSSLNAQTIHVVDGNVGIGTASPGYKLHVNGTTFVSGAVRFSAFGTGLLSTDASGNLAAMSYGESGASTILRTGSSGYLYLDNWIRVGMAGLYNSSGDHAYFDGNYFQTRSNYGINVAQRDGTTRGLVYFDGSENFGLLHKNGGWAVRTTPSVTELYNNVYATVLYDSNNSGYYLDPNGASRLSEVYSNIFGTPFVGGDSGLIGDRPYNWGYQEGGPWSHPYPDLIIGYHTGLKLGGHYSYGGTRFYSDHPSRTSDMIFSVGDGDGHVRVTNGLYVGGQVQAASFRSTSTARLKEMIAPMQNALETVRRLRGVSYQWKSDTSLAGQADIGFIAEEVDQIIPEIVGHDQEGKAASIDYSRVSAVLVEAVKEIDRQQAVTTEVLRTEIAALQEQTAGFAQSRNQFFVLIGVALLAGFLLGRRV